MLLFTPAILPLLLSSSGFLVISPQERSRQKVISTLVGLNTNSVLDLIFQTGTSPQEHFPTHHNRFSSRRWQAIKFLINRPFSRLLWRILPLHIWAWLPLTKQQRLMWHKLWYSSLTVAVPKSFPHWPVISSVSFAFLDQLLQQQELLLVREQLSIPLGSTRLTLVKCIVMVFFSLTVQQAFLWTRPTQVITGQLLMLRSYTQRN